MSLRMIATGVALLSLAGVCRADTCPERPALAPPIEGGRLEVVAPFGPRMNPVSGRIVFHAGVDLRATAPAPVVAMLDGHVVGLETAAGGGSTIVLRHCGGWTSEYRHVVAPVVAPGALVRRGETLANVMGPNQAGSRPRIHVALRLDGKPVDPAPLFVGAVQPAK